MNAADDVSPYQEKQALRLAGRVYEALRESIIDVASDMPPANVAFLPRVPWSDLTDAERNFFGAILEANVSPLLDAVSMSNYMAQRRKGLR